MKLLGLTCCAFASLLLPVGYGVSPWAQMIFGGISLVFAFIGGLAYSFGHYAAWDEEVGP